MQAGFISESWPASNRNDGRLQVGIPGRNKSESASTGSFRERHLQSALFAMAITQCSFLRCFVASTADSACSNWLTLSNCWSDCWDNASDEMTTAKIKIPTNHPNIFAVHYTQHCSDASRISQQKGRASRDDRCGCI